MGYVDPLCAMHKYCSADIVPPLLCVVSLARLQEIRTVSEHFGLQCKCSAHSIYRALFNISMEASGSSCSADVEICPRGQTIFSFLQELVFDKERKHAVAVGSMVWPDFWTHATLFPSLRRHTGSAPVEHTSKWKKPLTIPSQGKC